MNIKFFLSFELSSVECLKRATTKNGKCIVSWALVYMKNNTDKTTLLTGEWVLNSGNQESIFLSNPVMIGTDYL